MIVDVHLNDAAKPEPVSIRIEIAACLCIRPQSLRCATESHRATPLGSIARTALPNSTRRSHCERASDNRWVCKSESLNGLGDTEGEFTVLATFYRSSLSESINFHLGRTPFSEEHFAWCCHWKAL